MRVDVKGKVEAKLSALGVNIALATHFLYFPEASLSAASCMLGRDTGLLGLQSD